MHTLKSIAIGTLIFYLTFAFIGWDFTWARGLSQVSGEVRLLTGILWGAVVMIVVGVRMR